MSETKSCFSFCFCCLLPRPWIGGPSGRGVIAGKIRSRYAPRPGIVELFGAGIRSAAAAVPFEALTTTTTAVLVAPHRQAAWGIWCTTPYMPCPLGPALSVCVFSRTLCALHEMLPDGSLVWDSILGQSYRRHKMSTSLPAETIDVAVFAAAAPPHKRNGGDKGCEAVYHPEEEEDGSTIIIARNEKKKNGRRRGLPRKWISEGGLEGRQLR